MHERIDATPVAERLRRLRASCQLTQRQLADRAGVSIGAISTIERGRKSPRIGTAELLASVLDVPPTHLFAPHRRARSG